MSQERYKIIDKIGQGGVGAVYRAFDSQLNREVAIKRVLADGEYEDQEDATKQLLKEAAALSSVQHPHIVTIYDADVDDDGPYVVMELIHGSPLDEMVERGILTWTDTRIVAIQTLEALIAAQDLDLIHRDLKPSNIMVSWLPSGKFQMKIVDFGLAKFSAKPSLQTIDHSDAILGSIFFMAPEQFERTPLDKCTDMYSLGCIYYYALTGTYPFNGDSAPQVMASHLQHRVTHLSELRPDIPQWGADWIMWHIERDMDKRPQNARESLKRFLTLDKQSTQPVKTIAGSDTQKEEAAKSRFLFSDAKKKTPAPTEKEPVDTTPSTQPESPEEEVAETTPAPSPAPVLLKRTSTPKTTPTPTPQKETPQKKPAFNLSGTPKPTPKTAPKPTPASTTATMKGTTTPTEAALSSMESAQKGLPRGIKLFIIGILTLILLVIGSVAFSWYGKRKQTQMVNAVMVKAKALDDKSELSNGIELTEKELKGTLTRATSMDENKQRAILLKTLAYAKAKGSYNADFTILDHIITANCPENIRANMLKIVMTRRHNIDNVPTLLKFARSTNEPRSAEQAINAARASALGNPADDFINEFLDLIKETDSPTVRLAAERAATALIHESKNKQTFANPIYKSYQSAINDESKFTMLRLLGSTGSEKAKQVVQEAITSGNAPLQNAAIASLSNWPDDSQFQTLLKFIGETDNDALHKKAFSAAYSFLRLPRNQGSKNAEKHWRSFLEKAQSKREKFRIIRGLANQNKSWAVKLLEQYIKDSDDEVADKAERAKEYLLRHIDKQHKESPKKED